MALRRVAHLDDIDAARGLDRYPRIVLAPGGACLEISGAGASVDRGTRVILHEGDGTCQRSCAQLVAIDTRSAGDEREHRYEKCEATGEHDGTLSRQGTYYNALDMGLPASIALTVSLLLVTSSAPASEEGFGGSPPAERQPDEVQECLFERAPGHWVSCGDVVSPKQHDEATAVPSGTAGTRTESDALFEALEHTATDDSGEAPFSASPARSAPLPGPYDAALAGVATTAPTSFPLVVLREKVAAYPAQVEKLLEVPFGFAETEALRAEERLWQGILAHTEEIAVRRRSSCIQTHMPQWQSTYRAPPTFRMTPGGPVPIPVEERSQLPPFDPPGCERIKLVDEALIAQVTRLHEIRRVLQSGRLGFVERDERRALEREAEALAADLGDGLPRPVPLPPVTTLPTLPLAPPGFGGGP